MSRSAKSLQSTIRSDKGAPSGLHADREKLFRRILGAQPDQGDAHYGLAIVLAETQRLDQAIPHFAAALKADPGQPARWASLASGLVYRDDIAATREIVTRFAATGFADGEAAAATRSDLAELLFQAGHAKHLVGDRTGAEAIYDLVVLLDPGHAETLRLSAVIALEADRTEDAWHLVTLALERNDEIADAHKLKGILLYKRKLFPDAIEAFERSRAIKGDDHEIEFNVGTALKELKRDSEAVERLGRATRLQPDYAAACCNLAGVLMTLGRLDECMAELERGLSHNPDSSLLLISRAMNILYRDGVSPAEKLAAARAFDEVCAARLRRHRPFPNDRRRERRLRIGFVSGDFRQHVCMFFFEPVLRHLDRKNLELFAYSQTVYEDVLTERLKTRFHHWRPIEKLDDDAAANLIERDRIDILVDLNGHTAHNRLLVFARKPAPIQVSWIGFPSSTGMSAMDYRFTDMSEPPGAADAHNVETLWRLPDFQLCYQAPPNAPEAPVRMPMDGNGFVTFGCFNNMMKVTDEVLAVWKRLLDAVPTARLLLRGPSFDNEGQTGAYLKRALAAGLPEDRVSVEPAVSDNHFLIYNRVDVALDPFPYNGVTTSMDSLYMGVPFVALDGDHHISRMGMIILKTLGLPDLVAGSRDEYVAIAAALAADPDRLRAIRHDLRGRMERSPLMDGPGLARKVGTAFREMWRLWVAENPPAGLAPQAAPAAITLPSA